MGMAVVKMNFPCCQYLRMADLMKNLKMGSTMMKYEELTEIPPSLSHYEHNERTQARATPHPHTYIQNR